MAPPEATGRPRSSPADYTTRRDEKTSKTAWNSPNKTSVCKNDENDNQAGGCVSIEMVDIQSPSENEKSAKNYCPNQKQHSGIQHQVSSDSLEGRVTVADKRKLMRPNSGSASHRKSQSGLENPGFASSSQESVQSYVEPANGDFGPEEKLMKTAGKRAQTAGAVGISPRNASFTTTEAKYVARFNSYNCDDIIIEDLEQSEEMQQFLERQEYQSLHRKLTRDSVDIKRTGPPVQMDPAENSCISTVTQVLAEPKISNYVEMQTFYESEIGGNSADAVHLFSPLSVEDRTELNPTTSAKVEIKTIEPDVNSSGVVLALLPDHDPECYEILVLGGKVLENPCLGFAKLSKWLLKVHV